MKAGLSVWEKTEIFKAASASSISSLFLCHTLGVVGSWQSPEPAGAPGTNAQKVTKESTSGEKYLWFATEQGDL